MMTPEDRYMLKQTHDLVKKLDVFITGDDEPEKGVNFRLSHIERMYGIWSRVFWVVVGGILTPGTLVAILVYWMKGTF